MRAGRFLYVVEERLRPSMLDDFPEYAAYAKWRVNYDGNGKAVDMTAGDVKARLASLRRVYPQFEFRMHTYRRLDEELGHEL